MLLFTPLCDHEYGCYVHTNSYMVRVDALNTYIHSSTMRNDACVAKVNERKLTL